MPRRMDPPTSEHAPPALPFAPRGGPHPVAAAPRAATTDFSCVAHLALAVLGALAPVSRASFLALRAATGLPAPALLGALISLKDAGLVAVEVRRTGPSRLAFAISEAGRALLAAGEPAPADVPPHTRRPSAMLVALAGRLLASPAHPETQEGRTRIEADGQETPEAATHEPQEAPPAQGAQGRPPGSPHGPGARGGNDGLGEATDPAVLVWTRGVRSRNDACRDAHRAEGRVPGRLAALFDDAPPFPSGTDEAKGEAR